MENILEALIRTNFKKKKKGIDPICPKHLEEGKIEMKVHYDAAADTKYIKL